MPRRPRSAAVSLLAIGALLGSALVAGATAAQGAEQTFPEHSYTSTDSGDGTYTVPLLNSDVPDVSVTMVPAAENDEHRDLYYMISTTMHLSPGAPIMKSYDLVNWEIVNYVYDRISLGDASSLRNGKESYGQGQWASSLRYHDGRFYVMFNTNNLGGAYLYTTDDIDHGAWTKTALGRSLHDPSLFFDTDGTPYVFYGSGSTSAVRLSDDLTEVVEEYPNIISAADYADEPYIGGLFEGAQVYKIGDYYYIFIITWPSGQGRQEVVFRSPYLLGAHESPDGKNTYQSRSALNSNGFAQGGLVEITHEDAASDWYGFFFRDTFPVGRIPALIPATWSDGWPTFGDDGTVPYGGSFDKPIRLTPAQENLERQKSIVASDDFDNDAPHRAYSDTEWEIPEAPVIDRSRLDVELFTNGGFEDGASGWSTNDTATIEPSAQTHSGSGAMKVTGRVTTGSGPMQEVTEKIQHGVQYDISAWVKYDNVDSPATKQFLITARYGNGTFTNLGSGTVSRGQWGQLTGSFTVPESQPLDSVQIFVETPWTSNPSADPDTHLMDFTLDDVSLIGHASVAESPSADEVGFNGSNLDPVWQWNHNPDNRYWSLTDRDGWLRLTAGKVVTGDYTYAKLAGKDKLTWFEEARNTLSQRTFGPKQSVETRMDVSRMNDGDVAGLATYTRSFAYAAVKKVDGEYTLGIVYRGQPFSATIDQAAVEDFVPDSTVSLGANRQVWLKADIDAASPEGQMWLRYYYSFDGTNWSQLGQRTGPLSMDWSLSHFMGYRMGLFSYATQETGGAVDFDYYYLSDRLSADGEPSSAPLDAAIEAASKLDEGDYPATAWASFTDAYEKAVAASTAGASTQNEVDAPARALQRQIAELAVLAEAAAPQTDVSVSATPRCIAGTVALAVTVANDGPDPVAVDVSSPLGTTSFDAIPAGQRQSHAFPSRSVTIKAGTVTVTPTVAGVPGVKEEVEYPSTSCL